jgi:hypothetical protein
MILGFIGLLVANPRRSSGRDFIARAMFSFSRFDVLCTKFRHINPCISRICAPLLGSLIDLSSRFENDINRLFNWTHYLCSFFYTRLFLNIPKLKRPFHNPSVL